MMKIWFLNTFVAIALLPAIATHAESLPPTPSPAGAPNPSGEVSNINQAGSIQVNGYSGQNVPNCVGGCIYTNVRVAPNIYGARTVEGTVGLVWQFSSPEAAQGRSIELTATLQKYRAEQEIINSLNIQLAEALENGKFDRARIIAISLAPKLGYADYRVFLQKVTGGKFINP